MAHFKDVERRDKRRNAETLGRGITAAGNNDARTGKGRVISMIARRGERERELLQKRRKETTRTRECFRS